jgi:hypothetical protein
MKIEAEGKNKNIKAYKKNGTNPSQAQLNFLDWGRAAGASPSMSRWFNVRLAIAGS